MPICHVCKLPGLLVMTSALYLRSARSEGSPFAFPICSGILVDPTRTNVTINYLGQLLTNQFFFLEYREDKPKHHIAESKEQSFFYLHRIYIYIIYYLLFTPGREEPSSSGQFQGLPELPEYIYMIHMYMNDLFLTGRICQTSVI